ncbi:MAG: glycosyltransferase family 4 protein [Rhodocyclaceae bacterium]|nr:glycosyltransferase family 4 protein [Rhodocyclaceae bacterium]MDZ4216683.1 glycosyltransferase family 4 protein [Rhodocyclaceae bacterium]
MKVLLAATSYPRDRTDWKGRFIYDQAAALARKGIAVRLWAPPGDLPTGVTSALAADDTEWLGDLLAQGGIAHLLRRRPWAGVWGGGQLLRRLRRACQHEARHPASADLYLINWLQNALALPDDGRPAIVTVLGSDLGLLRLPGMAWALRRQFRRRPTLLAPNAAWMVPRLEALFGEVAAIRCIPFGVDARWFAIERQVPATPRWLVVSRLTRAKLGPLFEWGEALFSNGRELHLFGPMQETIDLPAWVHYHGATNPDHLREQHFPSATGLLSLSQHDEGRPQVMLEAMAAGLPMIASDLAAHRDFLTHNETGWLVNRPEDMAAGLGYLEIPENNRRIGQAARQWIKTSIGDWDDCAARYLAAHEALPRGTMP